MSETISIESDGTLSGTKVYGSDGEELQGITKIEVGPIDVSDDSEMVKATLTFLDPDLQIDIDIENTIAKIDEGAY